MIIQVTGGRDYADSQMVALVLGRLLVRFPDMILYEGGARGADRLCRLWAEKNNVPFRTFDADWDHLGNAAGSTRNTAMRDACIQERSKGQSVLGVAFSGGVGTQDMVSKLEKANFKVLKVGGLV